MIGTFFSPLFITYRCDIEESSFDIFDFISLIRASSDEQAANVPDRVVLYDFLLHYLHLFRPPRKDNKKRTLCLDMDDTLTFMTFERVRDSFSNELRDYDTIVTAQDNPDDWGMVYFRPYLRTFLEAVSKVFEVVVFTAACQEYADQILDSIDPENRYFHFRLYRDSCKECIANPSIPDSKVYVKDLRVLGRDLRNVILIDNSIHCFAYQLDNGIVCNPFKGDSDDNELIALLEVLTIVEQNPLTDVRRIFKRMYGLSNIFAEYSAKGGRHGVKRNYAGFDGILDTSSASSTGPMEATAAGFMSAPVLEKQVQSEVPPFVKNSHAPVNTVGVKDTSHIESFPAPPIFINTILPRLETTPTPIQSLYSTIISSNNRRSIVVTPRVPNFDGPSQKLNLSARLSSIIRE